MRGPKASASLQQPPNIAEAGANTVRSERWVRVRPLRRGANGALSSNNEGRLTAPSARSGGLDDVDSGPDCGVYIQMGGIEQVRVRRGFEGRDGPIGVALVAPLDVGQNGSKSVGLFAAAFEPPGSGGGRAPPARRSERSSPRPPARSRCRCRGRPAPRRAAAAANLRWKSNRAARTSGIGRDDRGGVAEPHRS